MTKITNTKIQIIKPKLPVSSINAEVYRGQDFGLGSGYEQVLDR